MVQLYEMLNAIGLQHRLSQEVVGNNHPSELSVFCAVPYQRLCLSIMDEFLQKALLLSNSRMKRAINTGL